MPKYLIERHVPGIEKLQGEALREAAGASCNAVYKIGPKIQWVQSFFVKDHSYCIYIAPDEGAIREHAKISGFPISRILRIENVVDPTAAD